MRIELKMHMLEYNMILVEEIFLFLFYISVVILSTCDRTCFFS